jgi:hypothetical protein
VGLGARSATVLRFNDHEKTGARSPRVRSAAKTHLYSNTHLFLEFRCILHHTATLTLLPFQAQSLEFPKDNGSLEKFKSFVINEINLGSSIMVLRNIMYRYGYYMS